MEKDVKIKIEYVCDHSYPSMKGGRPTEDGYSTARVRVRVSFEHDVMYAGRLGVWETAEVASKRIDWGNGVGSDDAEVQGAKWAAEGLAEVLKKLWPGAEG